MDIEQARFNMIEQQIRTWEVLDQEVLNLLPKIQREQFIPPSYQELAFADTSIPIGHGQSTMPPKLEARLLQSLAIKPDESVLEIGTGCGYLTALLACSAKHVQSIDIYPDFIDRARDKITKLGFSNIALASKDVYNLFAQSDKYDADKYDVIVLTASLPMMDDRFLSLLHERGRLFVIMGQSPAMEACVYTKLNDADVSFEGLFETDLPALIGATQKDEFEF